MKKRITTAMPQHYAPKNLRDIIDPRPIMNDAAEALMAESRVKLWQAALCERRGEIELADAYGAVAANKIAQGIRIDERDRGIA